LQSDIPTYSGGLGVLAGDTLKTMADFGFAAVGITLLSVQGLSPSADTHRKDGSEFWPQKYLSKLPLKFKVSIEDRLLTCQVWQYTISGQYGKVVPVYLLDTGLEENTEYDQTLTSYLYGGNLRYRFCQEQLLGFGGFKLLQELGYKPERIRIYHLNEGHAAFLGLSFFSWSRQAYLSPEDSLRFIRSKVVFTTHTPVSSGHDRFLRSQVEKSLSPELQSYLPDEVFESDELSMTRLALYFSGTVTGVARKHEKVTEEMFPQYDVLAVTNGVNHLNWTSPSFMELYDEYIPLWRRDPNFLRFVLDIPQERIWSAHQKEKAKLLSLVKEKTGTAFDLDAVTFGFARRMTAYKRPHLLLSRPEYLEALSKEIGPIQIIMAGKAHPQDEPGKALIRNILVEAKELGALVKVVYLADYNLDIAAKLVAGVDVWVNTPLRPYEASGTSGMKAAFNCVPHFSVLDGWWPEGCLEGVTGWSIGSRLSDTSQEDESDTAYDEADLYHRLQTAILPLYYKEKQRFIGVMKHAAALNASRFSTHRMVSEYVSKVYFPLKNRVGFDEIA